MRPLLLGLALVLVGFWVYLPSLGGPFVYDDRLFVADNARLQSGDLGTVLTSGFQETRPLTLLCYALCFAVGGKSPLSFHLLGLCLHLATAFLVYLLGRRLASDTAPLLEGSGPAARWLPEAAALIFLLLERALRIDPDHARARRLLSELRAH